MWVLTPIMCGLLVAAAIAIFAPKTPSWLAALLGGSLAYVVVTLTKVST